MNYQQKCFDAFKEKSIAVAKGSSLIRQGYHTESIFYLEKGWVKYFILGADGSENVKSIRSAPCIVGSTRALLRKEVALFTIEALTPLQLKKKKWEEFRSLITSNHELCLSYSHIMEELFIMKEERENIFLTKNAEERYIDFINKIGKLPKEIPLRTIASHLSMTPETLSRLRKKIKP